MADARVVVIGAGMGGLVSALELAQRGLAVTVVEAGESTEESPDSKEQSGG